MTIHFFKLIFMATAACAVFIVWAGPVEALTCDEAGGMCFGACQEEESEAAVTGCEVGQKCCLPPHCRCFTDLNKIRTELEGGKAVDFKEVEETACFVVLGGRQTCSREKHKTSEGRVLDSCAYFKSKLFCEEERARWSARREELLKAVKREGEALKKKGAFLPECLFEDKLSAECKEVGIFIFTAIKIVDYLLGLVGALALAMFVYGGFTLIISAGSPERVKKGTGIIIAAVLGLVIVFSAYLLVQFLGSTLGVGSEFKL